MDASPTLWVARGLTNAEIRSYAKRGRLLLAKVWFFYAQFRTMRLAVLRRDPLFPGGKKKLSQVLVVAHIARVAADATRRRYRLYMDLGASSDFGCYPADTFLR